MSDDRATTPTSQPGLIKTPDQLQQAKRPDVPWKKEAPVQQRAKPAAPKGGILHELETDRAHD